MLKEIQHFNVCITSDANAFAKANNGSTVVNSWVAMELKLSNVILMVSMPVPVQNRVIICALYSSDDNNPCKINENKV